MCLVIIILLYWKRYPKVTICLVPTAAISDMIYYSFPKQDSFPLSYILFCLVCNRPAPSFCPAKGPTPEDPSSASICQAISFSIASETTSYTWCVYNRSSKNIVLSTSFCCNVGRGKKINSQKGHCPCRVCTFSPCLHEFSPGSLVSFHIPKMCMLGELECLHGPSLGWRLGQGWFLPWALSYLDRIGPPVTLN